MPNPAAELAPQRVFVSSTVRDLQAYRRAIRAVAHRRAATQCLLSEEDWPAGYDDTVKKCLREIEASHGFLLILGHWYGSIPPGADRSITHIEFDAAFERWKSADPRPMAVMRPEPGSSADRELLQAAQQILESEQTRGLTAAQHSAQLDQFRKAVTDSWRTVEPFKNKYQLREIALTCCFRFRGYTFMPAAKGEIAPAAAALPISQASEGLLGALGRSVQIKAVKTIVARLADSPDVPAMALLATGDEDAGQRAFLQRLIDTAFKKHTPRAAPSVLPVQVTADGLTAWIGKLLNLPMASLDTPETVADRAAVALKRQPLICAIDGINDLAGGLAAFRDVFWTPFYNRLRDLRQRDRFTHRLVVLLADYTDTGTSTAAAPTAAKPDYAREVLLPTLGTFTRDDVLDWFDEMEVPDDATGRRAALADRVMTASKGIPLRAFNRLQREILWPPGD